MIPQEAIEAASDAIYKHGCPAHEYPNDEFGCCAKAALTAAAPFIRAQALLDAADELAVRSETFFRTMQNMSEMIGTYTHDDIVRYGAYSAEANTTSTRLRARAATERGQG